MILSKHHITSLHSFYKLENENLEMCIHLPNLTVWHSLNSKPKLDFYQLFFFLQCCTPCVHQNTIQLGIGNANIKKIYISKHLLEITNLLLRFRAVPGADM